MQKALDKVQCFAAAQAVAWLAQVQPDFWGDSQAESFLENVAVKRGLWKAIRLVA